MVMLGKPHDDDDDHDDYIPLVKPTCSVPT